MGLEKCKTFYGLRWEDGTLYFLKAKKLEDEFCVPIDWHLISYYKGVTHRPDNWDSIDAPTRRLLGLSHLWSSVKQNFVFMERVGSELGQLVCSHDSTNKGNDGRWRSSALVAAHGSNT